MGSLSYSPQAWMLAFQGLSFDWNSIGEHIPVEILRATSPDVVDAEKCRYPAERETSDRRFRCYWRLGVTVCTWIWRGLDRYGRLLAPYADCSHTPSSRTTHTYIPQRSNCFTSPRGEVGSRGHVVLTAPIDPMAPYISPVPSQGLDANGATGPCV